MELRFIDKNTSLTIFLCKHDGTVITHYNAAFIDTEKYISFFIDCDSLFENPESFDPDTQLRIEFFRGPKMYTFNAKAMKKKGMYKNKEYFLMNQVSEIKETTRRTMPRIEMSVNVKIFMTEDEYKKDSSAAHGISLDISGDGMGLLSDNVIPPADKEHRYIAVFYLGSATFNMKSRLLHRRDSTKILQYKYEYGFIFDYSDMPEERSRLITAMLDYQLRRR
jgi:c-di-GMP-binding flagellar brake protein YcgR